MPCIPQADVLSIIMKEIRNAWQHDTYITVWATIPGLFGFVRRRRCCCGGFVLLPRERERWRMWSDAETTVTAACASASQPGLDNTDVLVDWA